MTHKKARRCRALKTLVIPLDFDRAAKFSHQDYKAVRDTYWRDLKRVVDEFDKFEAEFYAYAQDSIPRSKRLYPPFRSIMAAIK